jgi:ribosome maturation factor RimP
LTKPAHFSRFVGHEAKVRTAEPMVGGPHDGRRNFTGTIKRANETSFVLKLPQGGAEVELPFGFVSKANLKEDI